MLETTTPGSKGNRFFLQSFSLRANLSQRKRRCRATEEKFILQRQAQNGWNEVRVCVADEGKKLLRKDRLDVSQQEQSSQHRDKERRQKLIRFIICSLSISQEANLCGHETGRQSNVYVLKIWRIGLGQIRIVPGGQSHNERCWQAISSMINRRVERQCVERDIDAVVEGASKP
jgi:hypothetical protein